MSVNIKHNAPTWTIAGDQISDGSRDVAVVQQVRALDRLQVRVKRNAGSSMPVKQVFMQWPECYLGRVGQRPALC